MIAAIVTAFYIGGVLAAIDAVMTARTPQGAVAWSISLVSMPFVALPAYLVLGRSKFEGMAEAFEGRRDEFERLLALRTPAAGLDFLLESELLATLVPAAGEMCKQLARRDRGVVDQRFRPQPDGHCRAYRG